VDQIIVFPRIWPLEDPLRTIDIRDYQPEDDLRHIHWKATARRAQLQVRAFEPAETLTLVFF
jgi:uncharacterized protein (DUF58 family)